MNTEMSVSSQEFDSFDFVAQISEEEELEIELAFGLKELKALIGFSIATNADDLKILFIDNGLPVQVFANHRDHLYCAELFLSTMQTDDEAPNRISVREQMAEKARIEEEQASQQGQGQQGVAGNIIYRNTGESQGNYNQPNQGDGQFSQNSQINSQMNSQVSQGSQQQYQQQYQPPQQQQQQQRQYQPQSNQQQQQQQQYQQQQPQYQPPQQQYQQQQHQHQQPPQQQQHDQHANGNQPLQDDADFSMNPFDGPSTAGGDAGEAGPSEHSGQKKKKRRRRYRSLVNGQSDSSESDGDSEGETMVDQALPRHGELRGESEGDARLSINSAYSVSDSVGDSVVVDTPQRRLSQVTPFTDRYGKETPVSKSNATTSHQHTSTSPSSTVQRGRPSTGNRLSMAPTPPYDNGTPEGR